MNEYFRVERPDEQTIPVVVDVPHAGEWIPDAVSDEMTVGDRVLRRDLDLYVDQLWERTTEFGATLIASNVSRYVVDLNRASDDISPETVAGGQRVSRPGYYGDRGVVWRTTTDGIPVMASPMTSEAFDRRIALFHTPYHATIQAELDRVREQFGFCILVDGHSMPSMGRSGHSDPGSRRADIVPGTVDGGSCHKTIANLVERHFRIQGYDVKPNTPYKGGWITRNYGRPGQDQHAIQIEVNRDLYMDETTFEIKEHGMKRLAEACVALLPLLGELEL
jgi:N-formylglutamate amidohydrolase